MPASPYVTLPEMRQWLGETDSARDIAIQAAIAAASSAIEQHCGRDFALAQRTESIEGNNSRFIFPRNTPITAVNACSVAGQLIPISFDAMSICRQDGGRFALHEPAVVTYTAGYSTLPSDVVLATKLAAQAAYGAFALDPNLAGESTVGFGSSGYAPQGPGALPRAVLGLLEPWRRRHLA